jgi:nicotinamidase-related amidase
MSITLDPRTTALVLIDLQKGILGRPLDPHDAAKVVKNSAALGKGLKAAGGVVVLVKVAFANDYADTPGKEVDEPAPMPPGGLPAEWSEFVPEIDSLQADVVITKRQWSAFYGTELDLQLRRRGIKTIVLSGVATHIGVDSTARDAWQHHYSVVIAEDACSSMGADLHQFSVEKILRRVARVRSTMEILLGLSGGRRMPS